MHKLGDSVLRAAQSSITSIKSPNTPKARLTLLWPILTVQQETGTSNLDTITIMLVPNGLLYQLRTWRPTLCLEIKSSLPLSVRTM